MDFLTQIYEYVVKNSEVISALCLVILWIFWAMLTSLRYIHMLQQNSYFAQRYMRWVLSQKYFAVSLSAVLPVLGYATLVKTGTDMAQTIGAVIYLLLIICFALRKKPPVKKPLVYTARVKRLMAIFCVVSAVVLMLAFSFISNYLLLFCTVIGLLLPIYIVAVLFVAEPIEAAIRRYYYNDAKKKLKSMRDLIVIGVTGSYGKTSTKHVLTKLLSEKYDVLMTPGSFNTTMGVVRTIREQLLPTHQVFVVEMGAKNRGDIKEICDLVEPKYGVISSIGPQHLETFGTMQNIIDTKFELADAVEKNGGIMFLNYDNEFIKSREFNGQKITYGTQQNEDFYATDITPSVSGSSFCVKSEGAVHEYNTRLLGELNVINIVAAVSVAETLGVDKEGIAVSVRRLMPVEHRLQLIRGGRYTIIDDAYNANPEGARAALMTLKGFSEKRILVTPGMVELGSEQEAKNEEFGALAATCCDDIVLVGKKQAPPIERGIKSAGFDTTRLYIAENLSDALMYVNTITNEPSVVLLENDLPDSFL